MSQIYLSTSHRGVEKSRRDDTLLTVGFNLRKRETRHSPQSPAWDDTYIVFNIKQNT